MTTPVLTSERITQLALELSMLSSPPNVGLVDGQFRQLEGALRWHRDSCRPISLFRRLMQALATRRMSSCVGFIRQQRTLLRLAADDGSDDHAVLNALMSLADAWVRYELGPNANARSRLALASCRTRVVQARFAQLVREGDIAIANGHLTLQRISRRKVSAYATLGLFAGWPGLIFCCMAAQGTLSPSELSAYLCGSIAVATWLTRGLFTSIQKDVRAVEDVNALLSPRASTSTAGVVQ